MPTTDAVLYLKATAGAGASVNRSTGSMVLFALRDSSGQFTSSGGVPANRDLSKAKSLRPHRSVPLTDSNGLINEPWERYLAFIDGTFLNIRNGPTLPDVASSITYAQAQSLVSESVAAALTQQANANAQSIQTIREVVQVAALPGAMQIPAPKLAATYQPVGSANIVGDTGGGGGGGGGD